MSISEILFIYVITKSKVQVWCNCEKIGVQCGLISVFIHLHIVHFNDRFGSSTGDVSIRFDNISLYNLENLNEVSVSKVCVH